MRIYLGCGLTHVPRSLFQEYADFLHGLASALTKDPPGHIVKYALINSDPQLASKPFVDRARLCYLWDREMVAEADLLIAEASFPSTGLGIEMQVAEQHEVPIILCFRDFGLNRVAPVQYENPDHIRHDLQIGEGYVSLMALGMPSIFSALRYRDSSDGIQQILETVTLVTREPSTLPSRGAIRGVP